MRAPCCPPSRSQSTSSMKGGSDGTRRTSASSGATAGLTSLRSNTVLICGRDGDDSGPAFAAARDWASSNDARFRIATERGIRGPLLEAAKRLLPLRNAPVDVVLVELGACPNSGCSILSESDSSLGYEQVFSPLEYRSDAASAAERAGFCAERPCLAVYR